MLYGCLRDVLRMYWGCLGMSYACVGNVLGMFGDILGMFWEYFWHAFGDV